MIFRYARWGSRLSPRSALLAACGPQRSPPATRAPKPRTGRFCWSDEHALRRGFSLPYGGDGAGAAFLRAEVVGVGVDVFPRKMNRSILLKIKLRLFPYFPLYPYYNLNKVFWPVSEDFFKKHQPYP